MNVTIYTTPTCGFCKQTKQFFMDNEVEYKEIDVSNDQEAAKQMIEKSGQMGVPVIVIEKDGKDELVIGFNEPKLRELLSL